MAARAPVSTVKSRLVRLGNGMAVLVKLYTLDGAHVNRERWLDLEGLRTLERETGIEPATFSLGI